MTPEKTARYLSWLAGLVLVILPFHAFLTVWLASAVHHYTMLRLWKEFLLVIIMAGAVYLLLGDKKLLHKFLNFWPARLIGAYSVVMIIWALVALTRDDVSAKAMWYGLLVNLRFLIFFLAVWVIAAKSSWLKNNWQKILLIPAIVVSVVAILQYLVLPYDFLRHFGYSEKTIFPYEDINHNINHIRVMSTLRGANPLGAYLLMPLSALALLLIRRKSKRWDGLALFFGILLALFFSFSRSAWLGFVVSILIIGWLALKSDRARKVAILVLAGLVVLGGLAAIVLRNNSTFQNTFLHTQNGSTVAVSSNEAHGTAFHNAVKDIVRQPWGSGVGTAGPQSVYNNHPARIAENYFLQLGQETGLLGMGLFIAICTVVGKSLWDRRKDTLALWLFASLVGITLINLLSHAWADDTLAYLWWGFAAVALATPLVKSKR